MLKNSIHGSFTNSTGLVASLIAGFPFFLHFWKNNKKYIQYLTVISSVIVILCILLSQSRAGILAVIIIIGCNFFRKFNTMTKNISSTIKIYFILSFVLIFSYSLYYIKKDSADGRLLIWQCSSEIIKKKPLIGIGQGGFKQSYMLQQAAYFTNNPDSRFIILADNVKHPFNELLLIIIEYGLIGFIIIGIVMTFFYKVIIKNNYNHDIKTITYSLLSIIIFSLFSYPLQYSFIWVIVCFSFAKLSSSISKGYLLKGGRALLVYLLGITLSLVFSYLVYTHAKNEYNWNKIAKLSLSGKTKEMIPMYEKLYAEMEENSFFLYNYATELKEVGEYAKSNHILKKCEAKFNDYDIQLMIANNYFHLNDWQKAEERYLLAAHMCPNRFVPLYQLACIYYKTNRNNDFIAIAQTILNKKVKIPSAILDRIKTDINNKLERLSTKL